MKHSRDRKEQLDSAHCVNFNGKYNHIMFDSGKQTLVWICKRNKSDIEESRSNSLSHHHELSHRGSIIRVLRTSTWVQRDLTSQDDKVHLVTYPNMVGGVELHGHGLNCPRSIGWSIGWEPWGQPEFKHQYDLFMSPTYTPPPSSTYPIHSSQALITPNPKQYFHSKSKILTKGRPW